MPRAVMTPFAHSYVPIGTVTAFFGWLLAMHQTRVAASSIPKSKAFLNWTWLS
jgi:hypothetical protein